MSDTADSAKPSTVQRKKLGRGLGALLGETRRDEPIIRLTPHLPSSEGEEAGERGGGEGGGLHSLAISAISPLPGQPRTCFDEEALEELASSIRARGVIQPIIVRPRGQGKYQLIAGERRWRAAQRARLHEIPAIVRDLDDRDVMTLALIENLQREDLNPVEEARAYQKLSEDEGLTQADIARMVDKSRSHVANLQRLLALPEEVLDMVAQSRLSMGHARALIGREQAVELAQRAVDEGLSVREMERLTRRPSSRRANGSPKPGAAAGDADIEAVQGHLEDFLGLPVRIRTEGSPHQGTVTIRYRTLDQLDLVCQRLTGGDF